MKKIGIVANKFANDSSTFAGEDLTYTMQGNIDIVINAGALPVLIPINNMVDVDQYLDLVDGLLLPGGQDVDPKLYGEDQHELLGKISPERDRFELALIKRAIQRVKPIFAICRGAQLVNVYFGGTLYQDQSLSGAIPKIEHDQAQLEIPNEAPSHEVEIHDDNLKQILGKTVQVNSLHHQMIHELGDGLRVTAVAEDGMIEGFVDDKNRIIAFQWHPEMQQRNDPKMIELFENFLKNNF